MISYTVVGLALAGACQAGLIVARNETIVSTEEPTPTPSYPAGDPPEIFPTPITEIPREAFECWEDYVSWTSFSTVQEYADETDKSYVTYTSTTSTAYASVATTYAPKVDTTLCDGHPRVTGKETYTVYDPTSIVTIDTTYSDTYLPPTPTCTVGNFGSLCSQMHALETSIVSRISSAGYTTDFPLDDPERIYTVLKPPCETLYSYPALPTPATCSIDIEKLKYKVLYWPEQRAGNFCVEANVTAPIITPTQTIPGKPNTARYGDLVMTSPTLYYILETVQVQTFAGMTQGGTISAFTNIGTVVDEITMSQDPIATPVSSATVSCRRGCKHCRRMCNAYAIPFTFADLATVPYEKYQKIDRLYQETIYQAAYSPYYTFPQNLRTVEKQWEICQTFTVGSAQPKYIALPTELYSERNADWTWTPGPPAPPAPTDATTVTGSSASVITPAPRR